MQLSGGEPTMTYIVPCPLASDAAAACFVSGVCVLCSQYGERNYTMVMFQCELCFRCMAADTGAE